MNMLEYLTINFTIMAIQRDYYFLDRLEELKRDNRISDSSYWKERKEIEESLEELCKDNPFNQLKEELNLTLS
jgi:hypothetical protein